MKLIYRPFSQIGRTKIKCPVNFAVEFILKKAKSLKNFNQKEKTQKFQKEKRLLVPTRF
jgi:hypothetical protein